MALSLDEVISLAKAGFTKSDIAAFMNLGNPQTTPPSPVQVPGAAAPTVNKIDPLGVQHNEPSTEPIEAPPIPSYGQMMTAISDLSKKVEAMANPVPSAGSVGALPTVTSVEDIIMGAIKPAAAPAADVDFMKGVVK